MFNAPRSIFFTLCVLTTPLWAQGRTPGSSQNDLPNQPVQQSQALDPSESNSANLKPVPYSSPGDQMPTGRTDSKGNIERRGGVVTSSNSGKDIRSTTNPSVLPGTPGTSANNQGSTAQTQAAVPSGVVTRPTAGGNPAAPGGNSAVSVSATSGGSLAPGSQGVTGTGGQNGSGY